MSFDTIATIGLQTGGARGGGMIMLVIWLLLLILFVAGMWKAFEKAGEKGWMAIIPFLNLYIMVKISDNAWWWFVLFFVPLINIVAFVKISIDVAKQFGQGILFGLGLWLLGFVFWPLLGFGDYEYQGATQETAA